MPDNHGYVPVTSEAQFQAWRKKMEDRLERLETSNSASRAAIRRGYTVAQDENGVERARIGDLEYNVGRGETREAPVLSVGTPNTEQSNHLLIDGEEGWVKPSLQTSFSPVTGVTTTSETFVDTWKAPLVLLSEVLLVSVIVDVDASTIGYVRLMYGEITSDPYPITGAVTGQPVKFIWKLADRAAIGSIAIVKVQASVDEAATGDITVYAPDECYTNSTSAVPGASLGGIFDDV